MELVGRDAELAAADPRGRRGAARGAGRVLGILGEAGIGKSALLAAIAERARERACWCSTGAASSTSATCRSASPTRRCCTT